VVGVGVGGVVVVVVVVVVNVLVCWRKRGMWHPLAANSIAPPPTHISASTSPGRISPVTLYRICV